MVERGNEIYIWNELHSIVVVKYKHSSISGRSPTGGMKKIIIISVRKKKRKNHILLRMERNTELMNT